MLVALKILTSVERSLLPFSPASSYRKIMSLFSGEGRGIVCATVPTGRVGNVVVHVFLPSVRISMPGAFRFLRRLSKRCPLDGILRCVRSWRPR